MQESDIQAMARALAGLMEKHLGTRGARLDVALRRAGRRLPRHLRAQAERVVEAEAMAAHPKLRRRIDLPAVARAYREVATHLRAIDLAEERKTRRLNIAAGVAMNLLMAGVALLVFLRWRGLV